MTNEGLIEELIQDGYLKTPAIIEAFKTIDRAKFVPEESGASVYENRPLPLPGGQTISQPLTVAFMLELLAPKRGEKILDVGAGSGWQTALLAKLVGETGHVIAVERMKDLQEFAAGNVAKFGFIEKGTVRVVHGDASGGYAPEAPYDKIIAAAAARAIPEEWKTQVKVGGRIVAPVGEAIVMLEKTKPEEFEERKFHGFRFVPLVFGLGDKGVDG
ncbi:MAG: protein-L-isoaspartate O-methyltransferase [Candidatus Jorgensenbacteria bacterium]|nr:protein-L-isoaspartate O-methyltransferase [Candidatus Jorgensenbacteria bacterium]